jgi:hypothetical protein
VNRRIDGFGISAAIPDGWEARIHRHADGEPTLHAATFALPPKDGEFGTHATSRMPPEALFLSLTEYRIGEGLSTRHGLFAHPPPTVLEPENLHARALLRARPGQRGLQRFFSVSGRAFCLYVVVSGAARATHHLTAASDLLRRLEIAELT